MIISQRRTWRRGILYWQILIEGMVRSDGSNPQLLTSAHRITASPFFTGLCWFYQGCGFKQWTGDDSKALIKVLVPISCISSWHKYRSFIQVYLPTLKGYVPDNMIHVLHIFLLLSTPWHSWYSIPCSHARGSWLFPSVSRDLPYIWHLFII